MSMGIKDAIIARETYLMNSLSRVTYVIFGPSPVTNSPAGENDMFELTGAPVDNSRVTRRAVKQLGQSIKERGRKRMVVDDGGSESLRVVGAASRVFGEEVGEDGRVVEQGIR
jgi:hypothetical protein